MFRRRRPVEPIVGPEHLREWLFRREQERERAANVPAKKPHWWSQKKLRKTSSEKSSADKRDSA